MTDASDAPDNADADNSHADAAKEKTEPVPRADRPTLADDELTRLIDLARPIADTPSRPAVIGRYEIVRELGRGGMGVVYEARDPELGRHVALKVLADRIWADDSIAERFHREARIVAQLEHPHIAKVFDAGDDYLAMQLIDGATVAEAPPKHVRAAVTLIRDAARAVEHAHQQGILHRDLKPQNLMLDAAGEHVFVLDFGLARTTECDVSVTGNVVGTPAYMSPEQAQGTTVDARADVYSLGATLYELACGHRPYEHPELYELLRKISTEDPTPIREHEPRIDRDLEIIVHHCLEREPSRRYSSAGALADDLDRWLLSEPIAARPPSRAYRLQKFVGRRRGVVAALAIGLLSLVLVVWLLLPTLLEERRERARSDQTALLADRTALLWGNLAPLLADAELYRRQGETQRGDQRLADAMARCHAALGEGELPAAHYFLGRLYRARGDLENARKSLDQAILLDPQLGEAHFERGLLDVQIYSDMVSAHRYLFALDHQHPQTERAPAAVFELYFPLLRMKRQSAIRDLSVEVGRSAYFREEDAIYGEAELARLHGKLREAVEHLDRLSNLNPLDYRADITRALIALECGDWNACRLCAAEAWRKHGGLAKAKVLEALATLWESSQEPETLPESAEWHELLQSLDDAVELAPQLAEVYAARALVRLRVTPYAGAGQHESRAELLQSSLFDLDTAIRLRPRHAQFHDARGVVLTEIARLQAPSQEKLALLTRAIDDFDDAWRVDHLFGAPHSHCAVARELRAETLVALGQGQLAAVDVHAAVEELTRTLKLHEEYQFARLERGRLHLLVGNQRSARADLEVVVAKGEAELQERARTLLQGL